MSDGIGTAGAGCELANREGSAVFL
jgi:hypothetical protein